MKNLILRNTPDIAGMFELRDTDSINGLNNYEVFCENGKIVIWRRISTYTTFLFRFRRLFIFFVTRCCHKTNTQRCT